MYLILEGHSLKDAVAFAYWNSFKKDEDISSSSREDSNAGQSPESNNGNNAEIGNGAKSPHPLPVVTQQDWVEREGDGHVFTQSRTQSPSRVSQGGDSDDDEHDDDYENNDHDDNTVNVSAGPNISVG